MTRRKVLAKNLQNNFNLQKKCSKSKTKNVRKDATKMNLSVNKPILDSLSPTQSTNGKLFLINIVLFERKKLIRFLKQRFSSPKR